MSILDAALKYADMGYSVIPVGKDKKPYVKWEPYQKEKASKDQIIKWWTNHPEAGIALVTGAISNLGVVDIDTEEGAFIFAEKIGEVNCPVAETPRGGKHLYFQHFGGTNKTGVFPGVDFRGEGGYIIAPPSSGPNGSKRAYKWLSEKKITQINPPHAPRSLIDIISNRTSYLVTELPSKGKVLSTCTSINSFKGAVALGNDVTKAQQNVTKRNIDFTKGHRDDSLFHVANILTKGGAAESEVEQILRVIGLKACEPPFPDKEIQAKVRSAIDRLETRERRITQEVKDLINVTSGNISVTFLYNSLQSVTKEEKAKIRVVVNRLVDQGVLEPTKRVAGEYRVVEKGIEAVDLASLGDEEALNVALPFGMEDYIEIMPKDLIVFAGAPNAGKTALMLETVRLNMAKWTCWYFSSEMNRNNAKKRIEKHTECKGWKFNFVDEFSNYIDIIKPNAMNFIDYVEAPEGDYFRIPSILSDIQRRLKKGIAFVALQKLPKLSHAVGGALTLAKPALFCSIDSDYPGATITMVKAKNYREINPNGFKLKFKIHKGINLESIGIWQPEY